MQGPNVLVSDRLTKTTVIKGADIDARGFPSHALQLSHGGSRARTVWAGEVAGDGDAAGPHRVQLRGGQDERAHAGRIEQEGRLHACMHAHRQFYQRRNALAM